MVLTHDYEKSVEFNGMAGLGPVAWSRGDSPAPLLLGRYTNVPRTVEINHDERKRAVYRNPDRAFIPHPSRFDPVEEAKGGYISLPLWISLLGMACVVMAF